MKLLLDTHIIIWLLNGGPHLTSAAQARIANPENICLCSAASIWEIAIKSAIGKLGAPDNYPAVLAAQNIPVLNITAQHAYAVRSLPPLHGDPFDRMLIAQAMIEDLTLMTHDRRLADYALPCFMV